MSDKPKLKKCEREGCNEMFRPRTYWQKYHSESCRKAVEKDRYDEAMRLLKEQEQPVAD